MRSLEAAMQNFMSFGSFVFRQLIVKVYENGCSEQNAKNRTPCCDKIPYKTRKEPKNHLQRDEGGLRKVCAFILQSSEVVK